ncbi:hypothetical protein D9M73_275330 [compost metagenome]
MRRCIESDSCFDQSAESEKSHCDQAGTNQVDRQAAKGQGHIVIECALAKVVEQAQYQPEAQPGAEAQGCGVKKTFVLPGIE